MWVIIAENDNSHIYILPNEYWKKGLPGYLEGKGRGKRQKLIARARCSNLEEKNKYWMNKDGKLCDLCLLKEGTIKQNRGMPKMRENRA